MKAIVMTAKGDAESVLKYTDMDSPEIQQSDEVKINIKAVGINPIDAKVRKMGGFYQQIMPIVLGCDGAGEIIEIGSAVTNFKVGDKVWFCHGGLGKEQGSYAEQTVINQRWLSLKPNNFSWSEAAGMPLVLITAWNALFERGQLQKGQTVLIHAGAGGVGHIAVQLAKQQGATVITTVSSVEKAEFATQLGADYVINYLEENIVERIEKITAGHGVDLVLDTVGSEVFEQSIPLITYFGRIVTLLDFGQVDLSEARLKNLTIGFELMLTPLLKELDKARDKHIEILNKAKALIEQEQLKIHISDILTLENAAQAHLKIEQGHVMGKLVLEV